MQPLETFVERHSRALTLLVGSVMVSAWTLFRHITNGVNFDVVGQIGLADQWAHGLHTGASLGATNYLLKIPLYLVVGALDFISPMSRLLLLALICNLVTFWLLCWLFSKILKLYALNTQRWLQLAMLWLASIWGNVFWADYANSRNLETVGGMVFLYLMLRLLRQPSRKRKPVLIGLIVATGSIVFFADSLQLYVCGAGTAAFVGTRWLRQRTRKAAQDAAVIIGLISLSYLGAQLIQLTAEQLLHLSFLTAPREPLQLNPALISETLQGLITSSLDIFGANFIKPPYGLSTLRELFNFSVLLLVGWLLFHNLRRLAKSPSPQAGQAGGLSLGVIGINYIVYSASGQALIGATARYLIMLPLIVILLVIVSGGAITSEQQRRLQLSWLVLVGISFAMLGGALVTNWPARHTKDAHIYATVRFLESNHIAYAISSRETAVTTTYFAQGTATVLPMLCTSQHRLLFTDLFYDRAPYQQLKHAPSQSRVSIIVPSGGIVSEKNSCSQSAVLAQFGTPISSGQTADIGHVLTYRSATVYAVLSQ